MYGGGIGGIGSLIIGGLPLNFDFSKSFGEGRFVDANGVLHVDQPTQLKFANGIKFDFSIGYDF